MNIEPVVAVPSPFSTEAQTARRTELLHSGWQRRHDIVVGGRLAAFAAERDCRLKMRLIFRVPYHEYADAVRRGSAAVDMLLEAYHPSPQATRCPPWASRKYRGTA